LDGCWGGIVCPRLGAEVELGFALQPILTDIKLRLKE
jgi:hypothetical protein